jgi:hypothetical protein
VTTLFSCSFLVVSTPIREELDWELGLDLEYISLTFD